MDMNRRLAAALLGIAGAVAVAGPAQAHGPVSIVHVTAAEAGGGARVQATVRYLDGDANVSAELAASAAAGGRRVPIAMHRGGDAGTYVGVAQLPPGDWQIVVASVGASKGTGRTVLVVPSSDGASSWLPGAGIMTGGALLLLVIAGGLAVARRRATRRTA
jgi:hypothetical protein